MRSNIFWDLTPYDLARVLLLDACSLLASCLAHSWLLKMEALYSSETNVDFYQTTRYHILQYNTLHSHCCLKSNKVAKQCIQCYYTRRVLRRPFKQNPALYSKCRVAEALKQRSKRNRSLKVAVQGPAVTPTPYVYKQCSIQISCSLLVAKIAAGQVGKS